MWTVCRNVFTKNTKTTFKNRKKKDLNYRKALWLFARPSPSRSQVALFLRKIACFAAGGIRTWDLTLARSLLYHSTYHSLVSILEFNSPHIIQTEHILIIWGPKQILMKKLSTTKFHNFLRSITFILEVFPSEVIYKIWISNLRNSNVVFDDKMMSNKKIINYKVS